MWRYRPRGRWPLADLIPLARQIHGRLLRPIVLPVLMRDVRVDPKSAVVFAFSFRPY